MYPSAHCPLPDRPEWLIGSLPTSEPDDVTRSTQDAPDGPDATVTRRVILLAEDQAAVRMLTKMILEQHGYHVHAATDGAEGLAVAESLGTVDLLLTDVVMPNVTGPELASRLAARRPGLPVLFMSGYLGGPSASGHAVPTGAPLLRKPFTPTSLLEAVRRLLGGSSAPAGEG